MENGTALSHLDLDRITARMRALEVGNDRKTPGTCRQRRGR